MFVMLGLLIFDTPFTKKFLQDFWGLEDNEFEKVFDKLKQFYC